MTQKRKWNIKFLIPILLVIAALVWACNSTSQSTATPVAQEQVATATTEMPTIAVTIAPTVTAVDMLTATGATTTTDVVTPSTTVSSTMATTTTATSSDVRVFTVDQSQSQARFSLGEVLLGAPKTVVGTTSLVTAAITIDLADLSKTTISPIQIDARDFTTDSSMRNNTIRRAVLQTSKDEYRYITFTPTSIEGLPTSAKTGDTFELTIAGDLTISGVTKPATFVTSVQVLSDTKLSGLAKTELLRSDYNLTIPSVPSVADVTEEVQLEFEFVANA